jgi:KDO2-lipid IV(A) lauroyltransferase
MKMDIPVFLITTARQKDLTHRIYIEELPLSSDPEFDVALKENVTKANSIISSMILRFPSQWVWMHRRWKRKPPVSP